MRRLYFTLALGNVLALAAQAAPVLTSSLTNWGSVGIYGPEVTRSGGPKTEIVDLLSQWDLDGNGRFDTNDGRLEQDVWTEASVAAGGMPVFKSYHALQGQGIPLARNANGVGRGSIGFRTEAVYTDTWTWTVPILPPGTPLFPTLIFTLDGDLRYPGAGGGAVALPPNFYPYNPLWGDTGGGIVVGPLPTAPTIDLMLVVDNYRYYNVKLAPGEGTNVVSFAGTTFSGNPPLQVGNGLPFKIEMFFTAGWTMSLAEASGFVPASFEQFATARVFDASNSGRLTGLEVRDANGVLLGGATLVDSQGTVLAVPVPVPEPGTWLLFGFGAIGVLANVRRRRQGAPT